MRANVVAWVPSFAPRPAVAAPASTNPSSISGKEIDGIASGPTKGNAVPPHWRPEEVLTDGALQWVPPSVVTVSPNPGSQPAPPFSHRSTTSPAAGTASAATGS